MSVKNTHPSFFDRVMKTGMIPIRPVGWSDVRNLLALPTLKEHTSGPVENYLEGDLMTPFKNWNKTLLPKRELLNKVHKLESIIQNRRVENILAIDERGNVIMHVVGERGKVSMDKEYWNNAAIITHNHPDGATLSGTDVSHLFDTDCDEIRACAGGVWYSVQRGSCEDLDAEEVEVSITAKLNEAMSKSLYDACQYNEIPIEIDLNNLTCKTIKPSYMSEEIFKEKVRKSKKEQRILSVIYLHNAMREYTDENNIIYNVGEL